RLALSREAAEELSRRRNEPDWLTAVRLRAFEAFERLPMPDQRTEGWRRTSLRGLDLAQLDPLGSNIRVSVRGDSRGVVKPLEEAVLAPSVQRSFGQVVAAGSAPVTAHD